jgi:hypothetical protein
MIRWASRAPASKGSARNRPALHTLPEMGMVVILSTIAVGPIGPCPLKEPTGESGKALEGAFPRFADDLMWWVEAAEARKASPY